MEIQKSREAREDGRYALPVEKSRGQNGSTECNMRLLVTVVRACRKLN